MVCVLLVEDDRDSRIKYLRSLMDAGFSVDAIADGADIEEMIAARRYDIILADTSIPMGIDGDEAIRELKAAGKLNGELVIGMSTLTSYQNAWRDYEFIPKRDVLEGGIGDRVKDIYRRKMERQERKD